jgi:hypothetical protein
VVEFFKKFIFLEHLIECENLVHLDDVYLYNGCYDDNETYNLINIESKKHGFD